MGLRWMVAGLAMAGLLSSAASAQVPPDVAAKLRAIGPKIEVKETGALFAAMLPKDFANGVKIERDLALRGIETDREQILDFAGTYQKQHGQLPAPLPLKP